MILGYGLRSVVKLLSWMHPVRAQRQTFVRDGFVWVLLWMAVGAAVALAQELSR